MYCFTDEQIEYILNDIRRNGIETEDLQLNLLDHVCCILEQKLKENDDFELFYQQTIKQFYKNELREVEEETINLLTFKNFYKMKKVMLVSGAVATAALVSGSFFKVMHWPGASVLLLFGLVIFCFLFLPLLAILKTREVHNFRDKFIVIVGVLLGVLYGTSSLFAVMHWPGRTFLWLTTVAVSMFLFIPVYFFTGIRKPETKLNTIITSVLLVGVTSLLFLMIALRPNYQQNNMLVSTYLHNEQLLQKMQLDRKYSSQADDEKSHLAASIYKACEEMKSIMLKNEIGTTAIPPDFEHRKIVFNERVGHSLDNNPELNNLLALLNTDIGKYNNLVADNQNKLPLMATMLDIDEMSNYNCLSVLTNITQLQMYLITTTDDRKVTIR